MPTRRSRRRPEPTGEHQKQPPGTVAPPESDVVATNASGVSSGTGKHAFDGFKASTDKSRNERQKAVLLREVSKIRREELCRTSEEAVQVVERCKKLCEDIAKRGKPKGAS